MTDQPAPAGLTVEEIARVIYQIPADEKVSRPCRLVAERVHALIAEHVRTRGKVLPEDAERLAWLEAELEDEPNRLPYGGNGKEPCRNGYECTELLHERAEIKLRAAEAQIRTLAEKLDKAVEGLRFYARPASWRDTVRGKAGTSTAELDNGKRARSTLASIQ